MAQPGVSETVKKVKQVEIKTKYFVDNLFQNAYSSVFKGRGVEFSDVREYQYGDDIRAIEWSVSARMGKLYVKQFVEERDLTVYIILDFSGSLESGTAKALKKEIMIELCASIAYSAFRNNDRVGILLFTDRVEKFILPKKGRAQIYRVIREVISHDVTRKSTDVRPALEYLLKVNRGKAIIFLVSDFQGDSFLDSSRLLMQLAKKNDMVVVKVIDPADFEIPDIGLVQFSHPETGEMMIVDTSDNKIRRNYTAIALKKDAEIKKMFKKGGIDFFEISTMEDYIKPLLRFFKNRERRIRRVTA